MKFFSAFLMPALLCAAASPAFAQLSPGGAGAGGPLGNNSAPQPQARVPDIAPPALPGAAAPPIATGPTVQKPTIGDPTEALFAAVNKGDYNAAQDAISRGANLEAQNPLGETPLDLSVALNRTTITFLLLSTRNELGESSGPAAPPPPMKTAHARLKATPARAETPVTYARPAPPNVAATPNPAAGFYGFGPKS